MYYPAFLNVRGRTCVVVGGGTVAERRTGGLLRCGADVRVISPRVTPGLAELGRRGGVTLVGREYRRGDLEGAFLAFAATGDPAANRHVGAEAAELGILFNAADDPAACTLITPAVVERGPLVVAISTGGKSPALARRLRERLADELGPEYGVWLDILGRVRDLVRERIGEQRERERFLYSLVDDPAFLALLREGEEGAVWERIRLRLEMDQQQGRGGGPGPDGYPPAAPVEEV